MGRRPAIERFLSRLPVELAASFSAAQLEAVELHFGMRYRPAPCGRLATPGGVGGFKVLRDRFGGAGAACGVKVRRKLPEQRTAEKLSAYRRV